MTEFKLACVLFDLDGTLVDTAPDLIACLNEALLVHDYPTIAYQTVKPLISLGAMPMIELATGSIDYELKNRILTDMLDRYEQNIATHSTLFEGIGETLQAIENMGLKWGIVTNKRQRFTLPLMSALKLTERASCIISGDSTAHSKPHPEPMLAACQQAAVSPADCVFVGDAAHDIQAGKNAKMKTLAATYGYLRETDQPENWGADALIDHPNQLLPWINSSLCY